MPGTSFGLAYPVVSPTVSGLATGSLVVGTAAILVSLLVICTGGTTAGSALLVAGAFAILAVALAVAAIFMGILSRREVARSAGQRTGRGMGTAGLVCGIIGAVLTVGGVVLAAVVASTSG